jgi:hypothetical protein
MEQNKKYNFFRGISPASSSSSSSSSEIRIWRDFLSINTFLSNFSLSLSPVQEIVPTFAKLFFQISQKKSEGLSKKKCVRPGHLPLPAPARIFVFCIPIHLFWLYIITGARQKRVSRSIDSTE